MAGASKKSKKHKAAPKKNHQGLWTGMSLMVVGAILLSIYFYFHAISVSGESGSSKPQKNKDQTITKDMLTPLVGQWQRPDGGYIIDIRSVRNTGELEARYYNPRPINVSVARASMVEGELKLFVELRDRGYPGATYTLLYDTQNDSLIGNYYQPAVNETFLVNFNRLKTN